MATVQLQADAAGHLDWRLHFVDGTIIRPHQHAAGAKNGARRSKRSYAVKAASAPKPTCALKGGGQLMTLVLTPGQRLEAIAFEPLMTSGPVKRPQGGRPKRRPDRAAGD